MRRIVSLGIAALAMQCIASGPQLPVQWRQSLKQAQKEAGGKKLVLVALTSSWDEFSSKIDFQFARNPGALAYLNRFYIPARIDADSAEGKAICKKYNVHAYPSFLYLSPSGELILKRSGFGRPPGPQNPLGDGQNRLMLARDLSWIIPTANKRLAKNPNDALGLELMAIRYAKLQNPEKAQAYLDRACHADPQNRASKLTVACNSLGDYYQLANLYDKAIKCFSTGGAVGRNTDEKAYSYLSIGFCYLAMGSHQADARRYAKMMAKLPNLQPSDRRIAKNILDQAGPEMSAQRVTTRS